MDAFESYLRTATAPGPGRKIGGLIVVALDKNGITHQLSAGSTSLDADTPYTLSTNIWLASCTKLITSIAALQQVQRGLITLDESVEDLVPELKLSQILTGFTEDGTPVYKPREGAPITLRMLLSHSSGLGYPGLNDEQLTQEAASRGMPPGPFTHIKTFVPMSVKFEPGTSWQYGLGIDYAGLIVERLSKMSLNDYFAAHILTPLGMTATSFRLSEEIKKARADMVMRTPEGLVTSLTRLFPENENEDLGGGGLWSTAGDYVKVLTDLLKDDSVLLDEKTRELLFTPALGEASKAKLNDLIWGNYPGNEDGELGNIYHGPSLPKETEVTYTLGGMSVVKDVPGSRRAGAISWVGLPNSYWMVDRQAGRALFLGSQLLPPADVITGDAFRKFEEAVYAEGK